MEEEGVNILTCAVILVLSVALGISLVQYLVCSPL